LHLKDKVIKFEAKEEINRRKKLNKQALNPRIQMYKLENNSKISYRYNPLKKEIQSLLKYGMK
jgi:hypothetical protein